MLTHMPSGVQLFEMLEKCGDSYIFAADFSNGECFWSKRAVEQFNLPAQTTHDRGIWRDLVAADDREQFNQAIALLKSGQSDQITGQYRLISRTGEEVWTQIQIQALASGGDTRFFCGAITCLMTSDTFDLVTGLRNNHAFRLALSETARGTKPMGVLMLGLDAFKRINNLHSYSYGDEVLRMFAATLSKKLPASAALYRLDGDCFGILYPGASQEAMQALFHRLQEALQHPLQVKTSNVLLTFTGAACCFPDDATDGEALLRCVRIALGSAKTLGPGHFMAYNAQIAEQSQRELLLIDRLRSSVRNDCTGFSLNYQPLIYADTGKLYGCEALLRWCGPDFTEGVSPAEFIPLIERGGMMHQVGEWVIRTAFHQCAIWAKQMPDFQMSVNVTCEQFEDPDFRFFVMECLSLEKLNPRLITLELTESNAIQDTEAIGHAFDFFRSQGIKIAFDDFGTGYASLDIFRLLSADELKIDRSFLERLNYDVTDQKIIGHLVSLCQSINMDVCVEGIETLQAANIVQQLGAKLLQGYYYSRPLSTQAFEQTYLREQAGRVSLLPQAAPETAETAGAMAYPEVRSTQSMSFEELVERIDAGIFQVSMDDSFTFLTCNEGYRRMLGYTAKQIEELFQSKALGFVHPEDMAFVVSEIRRQLGMGDTLASAFRIMRADGNSLWVWGTGKIVRGRDGSSSLAIILVDIDEMKRESLRVQQEHQKYADILFNVPGGVKCIQYTEGFPIDYISPSFLALMGYNEAEITERFDNKYINMIYEEDRARVLDDCFEQVERGNMIVLQYRSPCKDGRLIWLETVSRLCPPDKDGIQRAYSSIVDVTETISDEQKNRTRNLASRFRDAATQWGDILFEYNFSEGTLEFSDNFELIIGREPGASISEEFIYLHPDDIERMEEALDTVYSGRTCKPLEVRIRSGTEEYIWCAVYFNDPDRINGTTLRVLGKLCNIDAEKRERDKLRVQTQRDSLTGLLNKSALESKISQKLLHIRLTGEYALFMLDVDDFKHVNDQMGHPFGDIVLREISARLKLLFGAQELIGRVGGDEFMAFMRLDSDAAAERQAERLLQAFSEPITSDGMELRVSISIGIARFPHDGMSFRELFTHADSALYRAKERGKNAYCIY